MDEMTAFEQQLTAELGHMAGPGRRIDGMAMVRTVSAQSPKWRFRSMFSATKFVVAGAIVALFGGFLLSGVLTQPAEEPPPVVGASASAPAEPTDALPASPEPTAAVSGPESMASSHLLPGVDLVTEPVEPGVYRVVSDGVRDLSRPLADYDYSFHGVQISAGRDGSVWLHPSANTWHGRPVENPPDHAVPFRLGDPFDARIDDETNDPDGVEHDAPLAYRDPMVREDGTLFAAADGIWSFAERPGDDAWQQLPEAGWAYAIADDGSTWTISEALGMTVLGRMSDGSSWDAVEVPWRFADQPSALWVTGSGDVWLRSEAWFARYDGTDWQRWRSPIGDHGPADFGPDGTLWTSAVECADCRALARFDGAEWTVYDESDGVPPMGGHELPVVLEVAPDGGVWVNSVPKAPWQLDADTSRGADPTVIQECGGVYRFDGATWRQYLDGICVYDLDIARDGAAWLRGGTFDLAVEEFGSVAGPVEVYVITPEAVAAASSATLAAVAPRAQ